MADFKEGKVPTWSFKKLILVAIGRVALYGRRSRVQRLAGKVTLIDSRRNHGLTLGNIRTGLSRKRLKPKHALRNLNQDLIWIFELQ